jgi:hypothetical protein
MLSKNDRQYNCKKEKEKTNSGGQTTAHKNKFYMFGTSDLAIMIKYQIIIMMVSILIFFSFYFVTNSILNR